MNAQANVAPSTNEAVLDAYDQLTLAREVCDWMEALSGAICASLDNGHTDRANRLAGVAQYLSGRYVQHFEEEAGALIRAAEKVAVA